MKISEFSNLALELREAAAREARLLLGLHRQGAPPPVDAMLAYLERHLFEPDLKMRDLTQQGGPDPAAAGLAFHWAVGLPPSTYVESLRIRTAVRLLRETDLTVSTIAGLVGYPRLSIFSNRFRDWLGVLPSHYRQHCHVPCPDGPAPPFRQSLARSLRGERPGAGVAPLMSYFFSKLAPEIQRRFGVAREASPTPDTDSLEKQLAELDWQRLQLETPERQRDWVQNRLRYRTTAFFHVLCRESRAMARQDSRRALELAELALLGSDSVVPPPPPAKLAELKALAHAWKGHAQCLLLDVSGAERSFAMADIYLAAVEADERTLDVLRSARAEFRKLESEPTLHAAGSLRHAGTTAPPSHPTPA